MTFTATDFENATSYHPCSVGIVMVEDGVIVDEFVSLIRPPRNAYNPHTIGVRPAKLSNCCCEMCIELNHYEASSDARACAKLYLMK